MPVATHRQYFPDCFLSCYQQDIIETTITDLAIWHLALEHWASNGYRGQSVGKILEYYAKLQAQPSGDWIADAVREHSGRDPRLVEIAIIQVLLNREWRQAQDTIKHVNYFKSEIEHICTATVSTMMVDAILMRRRQQFAKR